MSDMAFTRAPECCGQDMVPELDDLRRRKVFSEDELRQLCCAELPEYAG